VLLTTNTNAGTTLRQIAFDKSVQRHLGSALFQDRIDRYRRDRGLPDTAESFSEKDLVLHFRGERREMQRYILDAVRETITHSPENKLKDYIEFGGKGKEKPLSYSSIEKTFYSFFIYSDVLDTPLNYKMEEGENPRELESLRSFIKAPGVRELNRVGPSTSSRMSARVATDSSRLLVCPMLGWFKEPPAPSGDTISLGPRRVP
jgi:hypothetical protein